MSLYAHQQDRVGRTHFFLIRKSQNALNFGTPTSTAEVASTFLGDFVLQEILKKSGGESELAIMMKKLDDDVSTFFRQVAFYRFEATLHELFRGATS